MNAVIILALLHTHAKMLICMRIGTYTRKDVDMYAHWHIHTQGCRYVCALPHSHARMLICMRIGTYTCQDVDMYAHWYIHTPGPGSEGSSIAHFYEKLLKLKDMMKTKSGLEVCVHVCIFVCVCMYVCMYVYN